MDAIDGWLFSFLPLKLTVYAMTCQEFPWDKSATLPLNSFKCSETPSLICILYHQFSKQMSGCYVWCVEAVGGVWLARCLNQVWKHLQSCAPRSNIQLEDFSGDKASQRGNILGIPAVPSPPVPPSVRGSKSIVRIMASSSIIQIRAHVY